MLYRDSTSSLVRTKSICTSSTSLKKPYAMTKKLGSSGASTKPYSRSTKDLQECIESSSNKENYSKLPNTLYISPTPKLNPIKCDYQSNLVSQTKRKRPATIPILEKKTSDLKSSKMSLELKSTDQEGSEFFRLYHEADIMPESHFNEKINKVDCDNDCSTDSLQVDLAVKYLESQLQRAIDLLNKS
jgi:hypothetical protein